MTKEREVKVCDFGTAQFASYRINTLMGTPLYMPPEAWDPI